MEDAAIVALYWARDPRAVSETQTKYGSLCRRMARQLLPSPEDAEECVNDAYHRVWQSIPPQRPQSLRAYLGRIVRNLAVSRFRAAHAQKRGGGIETLLSELNDCVPAPGGVEEAVEAAELTRLLTVWLDGLDADDRALFVRRYWRGDAVADLAREWGVRPNAMTKRLSRLRERLRTYLEREGVSL